MNDLIKRNKQAAYIMIVGTAVNAVLFGVKMWIGLVSNNISIFTDAINNLGDVLSCILSLVCFFLIASNKKTEKFPHGFGRLESLSSFLMSLVVIIIGGYFFFAAMNRLLLATPVRFKWTHFGILIGTVLAKIILGVFYKKTNKKIDSDVLRCAFFDSILDASITAMTVIGLLLTKYVQLRLDGIFGIVVSIIMVIGGLKLFGTNLQSIVGSSPSKGTEKEICDMLLKSGCIDDLEIIDYLDYGIGERSLLIKAVFTKNCSHDIINNVRTDILRKYGIKIIFIGEV